MSKWQKVNEAEREVTDCLEVPGGLLYRTRFYSVQGNWTVSMCFVPVKEVRK